MIQQAVIWQMHNDHKVQLPHSSCLESHTGTGIQLLSTPECFILTTLICKLPTVYLTLTEDTALIGGSVGYEIDRTKVREDVPVELGSPNCGCWLEQGPSSIMWRACVRGFSKGSLGVWRGREKRQEGRVAAPESWSQKWGRTEVAEQLSLGAAVRMLRLGQFTDRRPSCEPLHKSFHSPGWSSSFLCSGEERSPGLLLDLGCPERGS